VFTSDHGEGLGTHGEVVDSYFHGNVLYKAQVHVPLIFLLPPAGPGAAGAQPTGLRVPDRVRLLDVMPTLLDLVNIDPPPTLAGTSLRPFLEGRPNEVELPSIFFVESSWHDVDKVGAFAADWMYFEHRDDWGGTDPRELQAYDVPARGTATNRLYDHPEAATTLAEALARYLAAHPTEPAEQPDADSDPALLRQLRAVGYGD